MDGKNGQKGPIDRDPASHDNVPGTEQESPSKKLSVTSANLIVDGFCKSCDKDVNMDSESISCFSCNNDFHAIKCASTLCVSSNTSFSSHLQQALGKVKSTTVRFGKFLFICDHCITNKEKAETMSVSNRISDVDNKIEELRTSFTEELREVKSLLSSLHTPKPAPLSPSNPWDDSQRTAKLRSMVVIKNDENGSPIDKAVLEKSCVNNKISIVNTVKLKKSQDTAVILNSKEDADTLKTKLAEISPQHKTSTAATKLPRITVVGLEREYDKTELKNMIISQNTGIDSLFQSHSSPNDDKIIDIVAVVPLKSNTGVFKAVIRVSNLIRSVISKQNDRLFIGSQRVCRVYDNFFVLRCFKCQCFGHHSADCKNAPSCGYCAESHETRQCTRTASMCCINCKNDKVTGDQLCHAAYDPINCPIYKDLQEKVKKTTPFHQNISTVIM